MQFRAALFYTIMLRIRGSIILVRKALQALKLTWKGVYTFPLKNALSLRNISKQAAVCSDCPFPFHSFIKSSVASIGKRYPFRKNHSFPYATERDVFACWEYPKPLINRNLYAFH
jgi:hypothetical protein